ncbi:MAG: 30S ribosome-binding factor RbfA [Actinomycetaceae bacterium]|nr:30S ribosome-binding factor RbfA [Actinomycetaceae bacterium]
MSTQNTRKVEERIRVVVASLLHNGHLKDPRLENVTVTDVRVTGDLQHAQVFYTVLGDHAEKNRAHKALRSATGKLRSRVGARLGLRVTPSLEFVYDSIPETVETVEAALSAAAARDAQIAAASDGAEPAGDADPYKQPRQAQVLRQEDSAGQVGKSPVMAAPGSVMRAADDEGTGQGSMDTDSDTVGDDSPLNPAGGLSAAELARIMDERGDTDAASLS